LIYRECLRQSNPTVSSGKYIEKSSRSPELVWVHMFQHTLETVSPGECDQTPGTRGQSLYFSSIIEIGFRSWRFILEIPTRKTVKLIKALRHVTAALLTLMVEQAPHTKTYRKGIALRKNYNFTIC
jgi:hypothetical protein